MTAAEKRHDSPAGERTFQYEAHDERELNPEGVDPTAAFKVSKTTNKLNTDLGMDRERKRLNLLIERRKLLSLREFYVYEPKSKSGDSVWDPTRHARYLFYAGRLENDVS